MEVTVHEAKTQLSRLLKLAADGETVTIHVSGGGASQSGSYRT